MFVSALSGFLLGAIAGMQFGHWIHPADTFSVQVINQVFAIKTNKRTGETWLMDLSSQLWNPIPSSPRRTATKNPWINTSTGQEGSVGGAGALPTWEETKPLSHKE